MSVPVKTDEFSEIFQGRRTGGGGHFQSKRFYCRFVPILYLENLWKLIRFGKWSYIYFAKQLNCPMIFSYLKLVQIDTDKRQTFEKSNMIWSKAGYWQINGCFASFSLYVPCVDGKRLDQPSQQQILDVQWTLSTFDGFGNIMTNIYLMIYFAFFRSSQQFYVFQFPHSYFMSDSYHWENSHIFAVVIKIFKNVPPKPVIRKLMMG